MTMSPSPARAPRAALSFLAVAFASYATPCPSASAYLANSVVCRLHRPPLHNTSPRRAVAETATDGGRSAPSDVAASTASAEGADGEAATTTVRFRRARYDELGRLADLMTDCFHPRLRRNPLLRPLRYLLELDRLQGNFPYDDLDLHFYLVACSGEDDDEIVGFCDVDGRVGEAAKKVRRPQPYLSDLAVDPAYRRRGIASALVAEAERRAARMGFGELYLGVKASNAPALRMYAERGYEAIEPTGDMVAFVEIQKDLRMFRRWLDP